jgi:hypothetical protein
MKISISKGQSIWTDSALEKPILRFRGTRGVENARQDEKWQGGRQIDAAGMKGDKGPD